MQRKILILSLILNLILMAILSFAIIKLGGISYVLYKMKHKGMAGVYEHRVHLFDQMKDIENEIIFLGNSLTAEGQWNELFQDDRILNRGISGDMTQGVLNRLDQITNLQPAKIFLMIGVNDLIIYDTDYIKENYQKIVARILAKCPDSKLYIQSNLPLNNKVRNTGLQNADILTMNENLKKIAAKNSLIYIDLHSLLSDSNGALAAEYTSDGIHLNGAAYAIWRDAIRTFVMDDN